MWDWNKKKPNTPAGWKPAEKAYKLDKTPVQNWMFNVKFFLSENFKSNFMYGILNTNNNVTDVLLNDDSYKCIRVDLPKMQGNLIEKNFFGTKKSFVISRDYSGESTMEFWIRSKSKNDGDLEIDFLDLIIPPNGIANTNFTHYEFIDTFDAIEIEQLNPDGSHFRTFKLYHPQITNLDPGGELSYDGEEGMKMSITLHYDYWEHD